MALIDAFFNAIVISSLYMLVALGFTLIFGVGQIFNFAHGALVTIGAFSAYVVSNSTWLGLNPWIGLFFGALIGGAASGTLYKGLVKQIQEHPIIVGIVTLLVAFIFQHFLFIFITRESIFIPQLISGKTIGLFGETVLMFGIVTFVIAWIITISSIGFIRNTKTGKAVKAGSMSRKGAVLVGIDLDKINLITWVLAGAIAAASGVLLAMLEGGSWQMGIDALIISFAIVILGGLGSIRGSIVGAHVIGFTETFTVSFVDPRLQGLSALIVLLLVLFLKPEGFYGRGDSHG